MGSRLASTNYFPAQKCLSVAATLVCVLWLQGCLTVASYVAPQNKAPSDALASSLELDRQSYPNSCGLAALTTAASAWNVELDEAAIYERMPPSNDDGYSLLELRQITQAHGGEFYAFNASYDDLISQTAQRRPLVIPVYKPLRGRRLSLLPPLQRRLLVRAWWSLDEDVTPNHFVVVLRANMDRVHLFDPAMGEFSVSRETFVRQQQRWSSVAGLPVFASSN